MYIYIACRVSSRCMYSSCLVEDRSENRFLTKATLEIVARVRWLVCFPCTMRSVCCYFPAWPKLQHMWSCAWLASTGTGDDAGGGLGEGCSADADLPEDGSHQIHAANLGPWPYSCFPQYITLVHRDALVPYSGGPNFSLMQIAQTEWQEWMARP